ncbi:uncharacterized protein UMAG_10405 [Mycosarcoma maydis]|uniref:Elongin-A n=1 Tax=Mycosarcoma maydis TaxID=5270 RepID=A0A0D1C1K2_MYCMD|nr:uncharacterized protein UMAG_10405 [Ustilago maydis 521]KIS67722.1 hypothetical protein UMAG_10405 [Ustilago maydis 521]|eukprot:XP_011390759.1 hypothetical protein UMAG_10405 [Ustilago maydis 521]
MKDWRRSPEPPGMMGLKEASYQVTGNWGQPEELQQSEFDPASPLPHTTPTIFLADAATSRQSHPQAHRTSGVNSLYSMCLRVILRNISSVQDLGVLPYHHAKPILEECRIDQLISLEDASPHLLEHSDEIWKRNCLRDFIELRKKYTPPSTCGSDASPSAKPPAKEPKSWRRLYFRTKGESEQAKVDAARRIKDKYEQHRAEKEAKKLVVRDRPMMAKTARAGGKKFGMAIAAAGAGGKSKGQSLLNKARSGSAAQAKLTAPRNGRWSFQTQGRSKAVGVEIAPEAAGVEVRQIVRPMVAPRRVLDAASQGLAKMREFSGPLVGSDSSVNERGRATNGSSATAPASRRSTTGGLQRSDTDGTKHLADSILAPSIARFRPHEVAAAPPLNSISSSSNSRRGIEGSGLAASLHLSADSSVRLIPSSSSPPPDIARFERRKLDFFGSARPSSAGASSSSSPRRDFSNVSTVEVRGVKRAYGSSSKSGDALSKTSGSSSNAAACSPMSSPPGAAPSVQTGAANCGGVRLIQAKRARTSDASKEAVSSARTSPLPSLSATPSNKTDQSTLRYVTTKIADRGGPTPVRQHSTYSSHSSGMAGPPIQDPHLARASPAALSSIFVKSSPHRSGARSSNSRNRS